MYIYIYIYIYIRLLPSFLGKMNVFDKTESLTVTTEVVATIKSDDGDTENDKRRFNYGTRHVSVPQRRLHDGTRHVSDEVLRHHKTLPHSMHMIRQLRVAGILSWI